MCPLPHGGPSGEPPACALPERFALESGATAQLVPRDGGWSLEIDGVRQSHIDAPGALPALTSVRWMLFAHGAGTPRSSAHLGGGVLSLARAVAHASPGSAQVVVELEPSLVALAARFGLPAGVHVEVGDARAWIEAAEPGSLEVVFIDVFAGGRIPPAFTSVECFTAARNALTSAGVLIINSVAGPELEFTRRELATLQQVFAHVAMIVQGSALKGLRFGNATFIASDAPIETERIKASLAGDDSKGALVTDLDPIVAGAIHVSGADDLWSPAAPRSPLADAEHALASLKATVTALRAARSGPAEPPGP